MAITTFRDQISNNKWASFWLVLFFILFVAVLAVILAIAFLALSTGQSSWDEIRTGSIAGLIAAGIAFLLTAFAYFGGDSLVLGVSGAYPLHEGGDPELYHVVEEMAIAAGIPMPKIYLIDDTAMNAFATGRDPAHGVVAITTGLRQRLNRDELQGVIAHEMGHIRNYDIRLMLLLAVLIGVVVMLSDFFWRALRSGSHWGGTSRHQNERTDDRRTGKQDGGAGLIIAVLIFVAFILSIIAPILAQIIQLAVSRKREYLADASAVEFTRNPYGLMGALKKLSSDTEILETANRGTAHLYIVNPIRQFSALSGSMFSSHPPIEDRIRALQALVS
jgi:heat shock protein HtpX